VPADAVPPRSLAAPLAQPGPPPAHLGFADPVPAHPEAYRRSTLAPGGYGPGGYAPGGRDAAPRAPYPAAPAAAGQTAASPGAGPAQATSTGPIQRGKRPRDPYLDNVKFLLIALVPLGHSLVPTLAAHSSRSAYLFIYVFHMPLFVIISGYLSRTFWNSNAKTNKLVATFLVPYVFVEIGYGLLRVAFGHKWSLSITDPAWLNWYLIALLLWRLATPVMKRLRYPITVSIVLYLLAGLSDLDGNFSMDRFFGLMPFFVIGLMLRPEHLDMLNRRWVKVVAGFVLAGAAGVAIVLAPHVKLAPIYYARSYHSMHMSWWMGMGSRAALLIAALVLSAAILALVPRRRTWFSDLGTRTLYAYLLHGVVVMTAKEMGWLSVSWLHGPLGVLAIACSAFALTILLCLPETRKLFKWMLEPQLSWLYKTSNRA
jgi:fucose 4-O-acetylase-like acetyltransferase